MKAIRKISKYAGIAAAAVLLGLAGCHNDSFMAGFGAGVGLADPNKPQPGEIPFLTSLTLAEQGRSQARLNLSPEFSSAETVYQVDTGSMNQTAVYTVKAESKFEIVYTTGDTFAPGAATFVIVSALNGPLKTDYMVTFFNPSLEYAELTGLDFSAGSFNPVLEYTNKSPRTIKRQIYTLEVPQGMEQVVAAGVAEIPSARIFYSAIPLDLSVKREMVIQVASPGYNVGVYQIKIIEVAAKTSILEDVEFSTGSLTPAFNREVKDYTLTLHAGEQLTVLGHVKSGTVSYSQGSVMPENARYIAAPQEGSKLTLTAHNGEGYRAEDYHFTLRTDSREYAQLTAVNVDPLSAGYTLYKRNGGARDAEGFERAVLNYELYFNNMPPSSYTIGGTAESGATASTTLWNEYTHIITVQKNGKLPSTYHVFINYDDAYKPYATLSDLTLTGGALEPVFGEAVYQYTARVIEGANAVLRASPKKDSFVVRYDAANSVTNLTAPVNVVITVEGGLAYRSAVYTVSFEPVELQKPYLSQIFLDNDVIINVHEYEVDKLYYEYRVPWDHPRDAPVLSWNVAFPNHVVRSEYKLITSSNWSTGYSYNLTLEAGNSVMVQIRIKCHDGSQAVYYILLSRQGELNTELYMNDIGIYNDNHELQELMSDVLKTSTPLTSRMFIRYIDDSDVRIVEGTPVDSDAIVSYAQNPTGEYSPNPPHISLQIGDKSTVYIKLQRGNSYNIYQVVLSRLTTLFKVSSPVTITEEGWGEVEVEPAKALTNGIMAGELVRIELKPNQTQDKTYKIAAIPVVTRMPGETQLDKLPGSVPRGSESQYYHFLMPDSNVKIEAVFEDILSKSNELISVQAQNSDGTTTVYDNDVALVKKKIKAFFDQSASQIDIPMFERSAIDVKFTVPKGASLYLDSIKSANKLTLTKEGGDYTAVKTFEVNAAGKQKAHILFVVPDNPAIKYKPYGLIISRFPQSKWILGHRTSAHNVTLPARGKYQFQVTGAAGASSKTSISGPAGGEAYGAKGLTIRALFRFDTIKTLNLYVGQGAPTLTRGQGDRGAAGWGGKASQFSGTRGGKGGIATTAGGGGGGASTVYIGDEYILVAGGGGGAKTDGPDENGKHDDKLFEQGNGFYSTPKSGQHSKVDASGGHGGGYERESEETEGNRGRYGRSYVKISGTGFSYLGTLADLNNNKTIGGVKSGDEMETVINGSITIEWMGAAD